MTIRQLALTSLSDGGGGGSGMCRMDLPACSRMHRQPAAGPHGARCRTGYPPPVPPCHPTDWPKTSWQLVLPRYPSTRPSYPRRRGGGIFMVGVWCRCTCPPGYVRRRHRRHQRRILASGSRQPSPRVLAHHARECLCMCSRRSVVPPLARVAYAMDTPAPAFEASVSGPSNCDFNPIRHGTHCGIKGRTSALLWASWPSKQDLSSISECPRLPRGYGSGAWNNCGRYVGHDFFGY